MRNLRKPPAIPTGTKREFARFTGKRASDLVPEARLTGPMPWVMAIMVAMVVLAAAGGLSINSIVSNAEAELTGGATVQILEPVKAEAEKQAGAVTRLLDGHPAIKSIRRVSDAESEELLAPWIGKADAADIVPIPVLIDVRFNDEISDETLAGIQNQMARLAPKARIDSQASWLAPVFRALKSLQYLAFTLVFFLALTSIAAVWLSARSTLGSHAETIEVVHMLGGTDRQIARIFERSMGLDAAIGGAIGVGIGIVSVLILGSQFDAVGAGMVKGGALGFMGWAIICLVPVLAVAIAVITARLTVQAALRRLL